MVYLDMSCFAKSKIGSFCEYGMYLDGFGQAEGLFPEPVFFLGDYIGWVWDHVCIWFLSMACRQGMGVGGAKIFSFDGCKRLGGSVRWIQRNVAGKLF